MKKFFSTALLVLMIAALMLFTAGCGAEASSSDEAAQRIAQLEQENAALKAQLEELTAEANRETDRLQQLQAGSLQDWNLKAEAWSDGNGATVAFTATPVDYVDGMRAALSVRMGDLEAESTNCVWDGSAFTGSVELGAADGYSYFCILTGADGSQSEVALTTTDATLVQLGSSLSSYANLIVEDWDATASALNIHSGYAQCQMPTLTFNNTNTEIAKASLVLKLNDEEITRQDISLEAGEGSGSYETVLRGISFAIPSMESDCQLDLWLEISLNTGNVVTVSGGSWYGSDGQLQLVVG